MDRMVFSKVYLTSTFEMRNFICLADMKKLQKIDKQMSINGHSWSMQTTA